MFAYKENCEPPSVCPKIRKTVSIIACVVLQGKLYASERVYAVKENRKRLSVCKAERKTVSDLACA